MLLGKGVDEGKILFLSLIAAPAGIHQLCAKYPRMKVVTSEIDHGLDEKTFQVVPGMSYQSSRRRDSAAVQLLNSLLHHSFKCYVVVQA